MVGAGGRPEGVESDSVLLHCLSLGALGRLLADVQPDDSPLHCKRIPVQEVIDLVSSPHAGREGRRWESLIGGGVIDVHGV